MQRQDVEGREVNAILFKLQLNKPVSSFQMVCYQSMERNTQKMGVNVYQCYSTLIIAYLLKLIVRIDVDCMSLWVFTLYF